MLGAWQDIGNTKYNSEHTSVIHLFFATISKNSDLHVHNFVLTTIYYIILWVRLNFNTLHVVMQLKIKLCCSSECCI